MRALEAVPEAKTPRLLAYGNAANDDPQHPYLIMERLPGAPLSQHWNALTLEEKCAIAAQIGHAMRALHSVPISDLKAFTKAPEHWVRRMRARAANTPKFPQEYHLPERLLSELIPYLNANLDAMTPDFSPRLLNADLHGDHVLIEKRDDRWTVTGIIDFGDAEVGPAEYEWFALCLDAFRGDQDVIRAFFTAYGWPLPMDAATRRRLKLTLLLFRFPNIGGVAEYGGKSLDAPSLDVLLDSFWPK